MKIKPLEWHPYINNNEMHEIFGKIAYVKDHLNNILFYYLIIYPFQKQENYHIMIAGQIHKETFNDQLAAQQYCQHHFINTISQYKKSEVFEIGDKVRCISPVIQSTSGNKFYFHQNEIYTVKQIKKLVGHIGLLLVEFPDDWQVASSFIAVE